MLPAEFFAACNECVYYGLVNCSDGNCMCSWLHEQLEHFFCPFEIYYFTQLIKGGIKIYPQLLLENYQVTSTSNLSKENSAQTKLHTFWLMFGYSKLYSMSIAVRQKEYWHASEKDSGGIRVNAHLL